MTDTDHHEGAGQIGNWTAIPLDPAGDDEPIPEGGWGTTPDGERWQRRDGLFYAEHPLTPEEEADDHEYGVFGWTREHIEIAHGWLEPEADAQTATEGTPDLNEQGRRLASRRDDLIAQGVNPADLLIPLAPAPLPCTQGGPCQRDDIDPDDGACCRCGAN